LVRLDQHPGPGRPPTTTGVNGGRGSQHPLLPRTHEPSAELFQVSVTLMVASACCLAKNHAFTSPATFTPSSSASPSGPTLSRIAAATCPAVFAIPDNRSARRPPSLMSGSPPRSDTRLASADSNNTVEPSSSSYSTRSAT